MQKQIDSGIYLLEIIAASNIKIEHPKFNDITIPKGYHYYIGSAQKNLSKRLERHLRKEKNNHWHIDFLTSHDETFVNRIFIIPNIKKIGECRMVSKLLKNTHLNIITENFGNSDCKNCKSHLLHSKKRLNQSQLFSLYHSTVLFIPS